MGMKIDLTETVTEWVRDKKKTWETIGDAEIIIFSWYRMSIELQPVGKNTLASISITYKKPNGWFYRLLSFLFAKWYCHWCLDNMLKDTKAHVEK